MFQTKKNVGWGLNAGWQKAVGEAGRMRSQCSGDCFKHSASIVVLLTWWHFFPSFQSIQTVPSFPSVVTSSGVFSSLLVLQKEMLLSFRAAGNKQRSWESEAGSRVWCCVCAGVIFFFKKSRTIKPSLSAPRRCSTWVIICLDFIWNADNVWWRWNILSC